MCGIKTLYMINFQSSSVSDGYRYTLNKNFSTAPPSQLQIIKLRRSWWTFPDYAAAGKV